jgi:serine/threonine-protein kinase
LDGSTLNSRYEIVRSIGHGGAAIVYLGRDLLLNRRVAVKVLRAQYGGDPQYVARFQREAQAAASFAHPNIIDIYDVGEMNGAPYIVMEYIEGDTLKEIIENEGPFDPDDVASLIEQVAAALDYAHARGVIHRDVKPQNILVTNEGLAKVVDFGIAKSPGESALTDAGLTIGTAHYISPEQASGLPATPSSDVYSLGIIAYEMLCGQMPFDAPNAVAVALMQVNQPPTPPDEVDPEVPPGAADIVLRALDKDPTRRYPSAGAFAEGLTNWRTGGIPPKGMLTQPLPAQKPRGSAPTRGAKSQRGSGSNQSQSKRNTAPIPAQKPDESSYDDGEFLAAPLPSPHRERGNGTLWAGFFVIAALAIIVWFGGRFADARKHDNPTPTATTSQTATATQAGGSNADPTQPAIAEKTSTTTTTGDAVNLDKLNLTRLPVDQATAKLEQLGIQSQVIQEGSADVPTGNVIRYDPTGEAHPGDTVSIYVSMGDQVWLAPELQGAPLDDVISTLENGGLVVADQLGVSAKTIENAGIDLNTAGIVDRDVVGIQDNGAEFGIWVPRGTEVTLVYYDASLDSQEGT